MESLRERFLKPGRAGAIGASAAVLALLLVALQPRLGPAGAVATAFGLIAVFLAALPARRYLQAAARRSTDAQRALAEASHAIISLLDADELFDALARTLDALFGPVTTVLVQRGGAGTFHVVRIHGAERPLAVLRSTAQDQDLLERLGPAVVGAAPASRTPPFSPELCADLRSLNAGLVVPLIHKRACVGLIILGNRPGGYGAREREALASFGRVAAAAMENARLYGEAITDGLTQLAHRRYFLIRVSEALEGAKRYRYPVSVLLADVDGFRAINEERGHVFGDRVLREVAAEIREGCRETDVVARYQGDCFAVLLPETSEADARRVADRLGARIAALEPEGTALSVSVGIGVLSAEEAEAGAAALLARSETSLASARANLP